MTRVRAAAKSTAKTSSQATNSALTTDLDPIAQLTDAARSGRLVVIAGTGISMGLTDGKLPTLSWKGLIQHGFAHGVKKGKITPEQANGWKMQINSSDLDDLLGSAEFMGRKLGAPDGVLYARWLEDVFKSVQPTNINMASALEALHAAGIPIATLNYDPLLERVTGLSTINLNDTGKVTEWMRRECPGILHLHGSWDVPATCILGIRDYETTLGNDIRDLIQRSLASFGRLLFIGCGGTFSDPNFSALIKWLRVKMKTAALQHYALVSEGEVAARHADPAWHGFIEPLSFGADRSDLPAFLLKHFPAPLPAAVKKKRGPAKAPASSMAHARLLQQYRTFLLKDCGQMTIEGVRADMDTAQRRFDIERLFVPLKVLPCPPEIPESDPKREQKSLQWHVKNKAPRPFGEVFAQHPRLALLALPGGGKTLLLKRLAVAYADTSRRRASEDNLPDLDLMPVLIRCREWREHIHRPIHTLLRSIADITGHTTLTGLSDALIPLFKQGRILLLVDGLDEIHDDALRSTFVEHVDAFLDEYKLTRLVVTSREAGFSLVAPCLARFCQRWRVASLEPDAITKLCDYWHRLMTGDSPLALTESREVAAHLLGNDSLRRLAENPLLLTMLLVVKHGAGRLPPDRVSLYCRAVEVLLDTWNIKGHDPLNLKEAVPQLACVAFQLMRAGKQTATEKELLILLEEAREKVPQIRRYAKDTPHEFLKRVELRSSLLVEAGHLVEAGRTVPFYQLRHLTFQEYLAAVATAEGHYIEYQKGDSVLTPLASYLSSEKWKEVIPMAAVLARKQAEPLMAALVVEGSGLRRKLEAGEDFAGRKEWRQGNKLPAPVARLLQCLVEEAEAAPETLTTALQLVALFARGCRSDVDWRALVCGPYGQELLHQAWLLIEPMQHPLDTWLLNTCGSLAAFRLSGTQWNSSEGQSELLRLLNSQHKEEIALGLFTCAGLLWKREGGYSLAGTIVPHLKTVECYLFQNDPVLWGAAARVWTMIYRYQESAHKSLPHASLAVLDRLLMLWLNCTNQPALVWAAHALAISLPRLPRHTWVPVLTEAQVLQMRQLADKINDAEKFDDLLIILMIAFHTGNVWSEEELARRLAASSQMLAVKTGVYHIINIMLTQMGNVGRNYLSSRKQQPQRQTSREGMVFQKITVLSQKRVDRIIDNIRQFEAYEALSLAVADITAKLAFGVSADTFEDAVDRLGDLLGFACDRPEAEWRDGPDNLWCLHEGEYLLFETKSQLLATRKEINKVEVDQMNRSVAWFAKNYPGCKSRNLLVHPAKKLHAAAAFMHPVEVMRKTQLERLATNVRNFIGEFKTMDFNDLSPEGVQNFLNRHALGVNDLPGKYAESVHS